MRIQLIEAYKQPKNYSVYVVITIIILILITLCVLIPITIKNKGKTGKEQQKQEENIVATNTTNTIAEQMPVIEEKNLPVLTEEGIQNISNIYHSEEKIAYLTFDDGPSESVTPLILDVLKNNNIKATFFVLGSRVELSPELVKRAYEEGHYIANHGYSHVYKQIYASPESILAEYTQTNDAIRVAIGEPEYQSHLLRFPGGSRGSAYEDVIQQSIELLKTNGITYLDWNALTGDSEGKKTKEAMLQRLQETVEGKNSVVILMHDASDKILTYEVLQDVINYLTEQGYRFGNMYDLIK